jgi:hypothetical protein
MQIDLYEDRGVPSPEAGPGARSRFIASRCLAATSCDDWPFRNGKKSEESVANLLICKDFTRKSFKLKDLAGIFP